MKTQDELREYARNYYWENRDKKLTQGKAYYHDYQDPNPKPKKKQINDKKQRAYQEEINKNWRLYGIYIEPDEKEITKNIEKEEIKELLLDTEYVDYIDIRECEVSEEAEDNLYIEEKNIIYDESREIEDDF